MGWLVAQLLGLVKTSEVVKRRVPEDELKGFPAKYAQLSQLAKKMWTSSDADDEELQHELHQQLRHAMLAAFEYVDVLVTTFGQSTQAPVVNVFRPYCICMEELAQVAEHSIWGGFARHWHSPVRLAVGGLEQIPPSTFAPKQTNPLTHTCASSLQIRLFRCGLVMPTLAILHRFRTQDGVDLMNTIYHRRTKEFIAGVGATTESAHAAREHTQKGWPEIGGNGTLVMVDIETSNIGWDTASSRCCLKSATLCIKIVVDLLKEGCSAGQILYVTPYNGQLRLFNEMQALMASKVRELKEEIYSIRCSTIDAIQGSEVPVVVFDAVCPRGGNFVTESHQRALVGLTRFQGSMIVVTSAENIRASVGPDHPLLKALDFLKNTSRLVTLADLDGLIEFPEVDLEASDR